MEYARSEHQATLLRDGLIVGGASSSSSSSSNAIADTYDPATGDWSPTAPLPMTVGNGAIAVRLLDGRVLVACGGNRW